MKPLEERSWEESVALQLLLQRYRLRPDQMSLVVERIRVAFRKWDALGECTCTYPADLSEDQVLQFKRFVYESRRELRQEVLRRVIEERVEREVLTL